MNKERTGKCLQQEEHKRFEMHFHCIVLSCVLYCPLYCFCLVYFIVHCIVFVLCTLLSIVLFLSCVLYCPLYCSVLCTLLSIVLFLFCVFYCPLYCFCFVYFIVHCIVFVIPSPTNLWRDIVTLPSVRQGQRSGSNFYCITFLWTL
jgi:hypothetical protein